MGKGKYRRATAALSLAIVAGSSTTGCNALRNLEDNPRQIGGPFTTGAGTCTGKLPVLAWAKDTKAEGDVRFANATEPCVPVYSSLDSTQEIAQLPARQAFVLGCLAGGQLVTVTFGNTTGFVPYSTGFQNQLNANVFSVGPC